MTATPIVKLGAVFLEGARAYEWELAAGVNPVEKLFTVTVDCAEKLRPSLAQPLDFTVEREGGEPLVIKNLYPLEILPGSEPYLRQIRVADRRWLWPRAWVAASFNVRRAKGNKFLVNADRLENAIVQPEIEYEFYSLYPPDAPATPWTAERVLNHVLEDPFHGLGTPMQIDSSLSGIEVQDLVLDDQGHHALERVLAYIPGAGVYIDHNGTAVVYDTLSTVDVELAGELVTRGRLKTGPELLIADRSATRPQTILTYFSVEAEVKFTYSEDSTAGADTPSLTNEAPLPDIQLEVGGKTLARGSYVRLTDLFSAWGPFGFRRREMSNEILRKTMFRHGWAGFEQEFGNDPNAPPDPVAVARARTAAQHFRGTFRIDSKFMGRLEAILPFRAALLNTETGARAPAEAYCDYVRRPSIRGIAIGNESNQNQGWRVRGYNAKLADATVAPATVVIVDPQAGIVRVVPQLDPFGAYQQIALGYPTGELPGSKGLGVANQTGTEAACRWDLVELEPAFNLALVLTVVPGSPNNTRRFFVVSNTEVGVPGGSGPTFKSRIFPGVMTARFAWQDARAEEILATIRGAGTWLTLSDLLVNRDDVYAVAEANCKRIMEGFRDRPIGGADVDLWPDLRIAGSLGRILHVMAGGATVTQARFVGAQQAVDLWRFMNDSTRRVILKTLNQEA